MFLDFIDTYHHTQLDVPNQTAWSSVKKRITTPANQMSKIPKVYYFFSAENRESLFGFLGNCNARSNQGPLAERLTQNTVTGGAKRLQ